MRREEGKTEMPQPDEFSALSPELQLNAKTETSRIRVKSLHTGTIFSKIC